MTNEEQKDKYREWLYGRVRGRLRELVAKGGI